jgi:hypothetical protein
MRVFSQIIEAQEKAASSRRIQIVVLPNYGAESKVLTAGPKVINVSHPFGNPAPN